MIANRERPAGDDLMDGPTSHGASDLDVVAASIADPERFGVIYLRYETNVLSYLIRCVGRPDADDLCGEVFAEAFRLRQRWEPLHDSMLPWLMGIARNSVNRHWRNESRKTRAYGRYSVRYRDTPSDGLDGVEDRIDALAVDPALRAALWSLAEEDRETVLLAAWSGLSQPEIAEALGVPLGTVKSRLNRIRSRLRAALAEDPR